jgi:hypothetical protein
VKKIATLISGGVITWLLLCLWAAIDIWREAKADYVAMGGTCTPDCVCKCQQVTCGCHIKPPRPGAPIRPRKKAPGESIAPAA